MELFLPMTVGVTIYIWSLPMPTIKDTGSSKNNDIVISTVSYDASKHSGIRSVFLSGDENQVLSRWYSNFTR